MSRSYKQPIEKDNKYRKYWKSVRSVQKQDLIRSASLVDTEEIEIRPAKSIVNDYDYCDYIFRDCGIKYKRK